VSERHTGLEGRWLLGFLALASLDGALLLLRFSWSSVPVALATLGYSAGLALLLGLAVTLVDALVRRAPGGRLLGGLLVLGLGHLVLRPDVLPRAARLPGLGAGPWSWLLTTTLLAPCVLAVVAMEVLRRWSAGQEPTWQRTGRGVLVAGPLVLQAFNHRLLAGNYPGVHLLLQLTCGLMLSLALAPRPAGRLVVLGLLGVLAPLVEPPRGLRAELLRHPGLGLAPFLLEARRREAPVVSLRPTPPPRPASIPPPFPAPPVVVLAVVDCMRHDVLDTHGGRLPSLQRLRAGAVDFRQARTMAPATTVAVASMLAGRPFSTLRWGPGGVTGELVPLPDETPRFTSQLMQRGVPTVVVTSGDWMLPSWQLLEGFSETRTPPRQGLISPAREVAREAVERLRAHDGGPLFLYLHFLDAHSPYDLGGTEGDDRERYVRELALVDQALARVVEAIDQAPWADRSLLIVTADHGEAFGEHGYLFHATMLYDEVLRVPLVLRSPLLAPRAVEVPVSLADIAPTILDAFRESAPGPLEGRSLWPLLRGEPWPERVIVADSGRHQRAMIFPDGFKVIHDRRRDTAELYNLRQDPAETRNLYAEEPLNTPHLDALVRYFGERVIKDPPLRLP
jgi:hypothetical protein